jgi:hypothetical protein
VIADARLAVEEFGRRLCTGFVRSDIDEPDVLNLAAAAALAAGVTSDVSLLANHVSS